jgi:RNA polymerase sigma factor (TIGR02999 family)
VADITELLRDASAGDAAASRALFERLYAELKRLAHGNLRRNGGRDELDTTMLVHEAYVKLASRKALLPPDRAAFFAYVGKAMRSVVVDTIRERRAAKRGGGQVPLTLTTGIADEAVEDERLLAIDDALHELGRLAPDLHALVEMRYFAGLSVPEVAQALSRPLRSVERDWQKARAILRALLEGP